MEPTPNPSFTPHTTLPSGLASVAPRPGVADRASAEQQLATGATLRAGLMFNAELSAITGLIATLFGGPLGDWMGADPTVVRLVGLCFVAYVPVLLWFRSRRPLRRWHGLLPASLDEAWVVLAIATASAGAGLTAGGRWLMAATTVPVGLSAAWQYLGVRRL